MNIVFVNFLKVFNATKAKLYDENFNDSSVTRNSDKHDK